MNDCMILSDSPNFYKSPDQMISRGIQDHGLFFTLFSTIFFIQELRRGGSRVLNMKKEFLSPLPNPDLLPRRCSPCSVLMANAREKGLYFKVIHDDFWTKMKNSPLEKNWVKKMNKSPLQREFIKCYLLLMRKK